MKTIYLTLYALILCITVSCRLFSPGNTITLVLPSIPANWAHFSRELDYSLEYPGNGGIKTIDLERGERIVDVELPKVINAPVVCYPRIMGFGLAPCGCILPGDLTEPGKNEALLSWERGFAASILLSLFKQGFDISVINAKRLVSEIEKKSLYGDPWRCDRNRIEQSLALYDFSVYEVAQLPTFYVEIAPINGTWCSSDPFMELLNADSGNRLIIPELPLGFHRLFSVTGTKILDVTASEKEIRWILYDRPPLAPAIEEGESLIP